jgi:hypothetical protein
MNFKFPLKNFMFVLVMLSIASMITPLSSFASLEFNSEKNLSLSDASSTEVQIAEDGNIYVVWKEDNDIFFKRSLDGGDTFETSLNVTKTSGVTSQSPQIASSGTNVSIVWQEGSTGDINIVSSKTSGASFGGITNLSANGGDSKLPQLAVSGNNIFVVWQDNDDGDTDIYFKRSSDAGDTFIDFQNISDAIGSGSLAPQLAENGSDVFATWAEGGFFSADVYLSSSTSTGLSSLTASNLSGDSSSKNAQVAASGDNVAVVWISGNKDINIKTSIDGGATFGTTNTLSSSPVNSNDPQIAISGNDIHVVWSDGDIGSGDILYIKSPNGGSTYDDLINLSQNDGLSENAQISAFGDNIFVVWKDDSFAADSNIIARSSDDGGSTFGAFQKVSDNDAASVDPQLASSGADVFIVWVDNSAGNNEILFRAGTESSATISFDLSQYKVGESPLVTLTNSTAINAIHNETTTAIITSDSDIGGISLTLTEDADTGNFTNSFTLTGGISIDNESLHAEANDIITATIGGISGSASIFPQTKVQTPIQQVKKQSKL